MKAGSRFPSILSRRKLLQRTALSGFGMLALSMAGCGGGDDDPTSTPTTGAAQASPTETPQPEATPTEPATEAPTDEPSPTQAPTEAPTATPAEPTTTPTPEPTATPLPDRIWEPLIPSDQPIDATPSARRDHSLIYSAANGQLVLFGGRDASGPLGDTWVYDIVDNLWKPVNPDGDAPAARFGHNAAYDSALNQMLIFGGQAGSTFFNDSWGLDLATNSWTQYAPAQPLPQQRYGAASAYDATAGSFYISHGFTSQGRFDDTWGFQPTGSAWANVSPVDGVRPEARCLVRMGADAAASRLYLFGGQSNTEAFKGDFWAFDIATQSWTELDIERPSRRNLYSLALKPEAGQLVLYAGASPEGALNDVWVYDFAGGGWAMIPYDGTVPPARDSHDAAWNSEASALYVFGGRSGDGSLLRDLWKFTLR